MIAESNLPVMSKVVPLAFTVEQTPTVSVETVNAGRLGFKAAKRGRRLAGRLLLWLLKLIGADVFVPMRFNKVSEQSPYIRADTLRAAAEAHIRSVLDHGYRPAALLVGRQQLAELEIIALGQAVNPQCLGPLQMRWNITASGGAQPEVRIFGVEVVAVPWMDGIACLPDLRQLR